MDKDKKRLFDSMVNGLKKKWGNEVICEAVHKDIPTFSTGSPLLDAAIAGDGYPRGRFVEIYGDESSGKTTTAILMLANAQRAEPEKYIGFIDVEHAFNVPYANKLGLDTERPEFIFAQPNSAEEALEVLLAFCESGLFSAVCFDSIGGLVTKAQLEKGIDEETMGSLARVLSKSAARIHTAAENNETTVIWLNQTRNKIVMMGNPETVTGGKTLPFFHSVRIKVRRKEILMNKDVPIGQEVEYKIIKNKVGTPFGVVVTSLFFGIGFDEVREVVEVGYTNGTISAAGAWAYLDKGTDKEIKWNGKAACIEYYRDKPEEFAVLKARVMGTHTTEIDIRVANEESAAIAEEA